MNVPTSLTRPPDFSNPLAETDTTDTAERPELTIVSSSSDVPVSGDTVDRSEEQERTVWTDADVERRRRAEVITRAPKLALAVLSFVARSGRLSVKQLIEDGPTEQLFEIVFDLYDVGLLSRNRAEVRVSAAGEELLRRSGMADA